MICTFGLMDFMIVYKWLTSFANPGDAPSVITLLIGLALTPFDEPNPPLWNPSSELMVNQACIAIALICVPLMLFPKPFLLKSQMEAARPGHTHSKVSDRQERLSQPLIQV